MRTMDFNIDPTSTSSINGNTTYTVEVNSMATAVGAAFPTEKKK